MATGKQIRAARALAGWDAKELCAHIGISEMSISNIERGTFRPRVSTMDKIAQAFGGVGIEFTENEGVRRRPESIDIFEGHERFHEFTDYVFKYLESNGGDVCISASDERLFQKYRKEPELYRQRMKSMVDSGHITARILAEESTFHSVFAEIRKLKTHAAAPTSFYSFGQNLALISFTHSPPPYVVLFKNSPFVEAFRQAFEAAWAGAKTGEA